MASTNVFPNLVRLAVVIMVPTLACFGYYTLDALDDSRSAWVVPAVLAYPAALIGLIGLVSTLRDASATRTRLALWALCLAAPVVLLLWLRS
jgi:hypothetical protein